MKLAHKEVAQAIRSEMESVYDVIRRTGGEDTDWTSGQLMGIRNTANRIATYLVSDMSFDIDAFISTCGTETINEDPLVKEYTSW